MPSRRAAVAAYHLTPYPRGIGAPDDSSAGRLYSELGSVALADYRAKPECRADVLAIVTAERLKLSPHDKR